MSWLDWLVSVPAVRVVDVPRPYDREDGRAPNADPFGSQRSATLAALFHSGDEPVGLVWTRSASGGPVELIGLGRSVFPPAAGTEPTSVTDRLAAFRWWLPLSGRFDGLTVSEHEPRRTRSAGPALENGLLSVWTDPFVLAVFAVPVRSEQLRTVVDEVTGRVRYVKQRAESNPERAIEHERLRAWHRELRASESSGLWRVGVYAAGGDPDAAAAVAGLAVASVDLVDTGYVLTAKGRPAGTESTLAAPDSTFLAGSVALTALTKLPASEVPGLRLVLPPEFDITPEPQAAGSALRLGAVLDRDLRTEPALTVPLPSLNRHTFVCGATGGGKSQTVRHLLEQATTQGIPWLVLEPAKAEYARMANRIPEHELIVVRPGDPRAVPAGIDPLRPVDGFPLQTHLDLVRALFLAAFDADEPFPQVLAAALTRAYEEQGWDIALGEARSSQQHPRYPTLADLERTALRVVDEIGYGREVADNVRGFVRVRLSALRLGTTGLFLEGGHPLDIAKLLSHNVVLEIENVGDDRDKGFLIGTVLIALTEHLRMAERNGTLVHGELRHLTVIEEAHRLLRRTDEQHGAAAQAVEMFTALLAEVRAYGEGLVIAEQIPAKLIPDAIKNTAVKIVHRLPAKDDRDAVGATMNLSDAQSSYLVTLEPGTAAAFADGMDQPLLVRMPDGTERENERSPVGYGPDQIVRPESGRCFADYGLLGTSLADLVRGQRLVDETPLLRWWVELGVVAHLLGLPTVAPTPDLCALLGAAEVRVVACGLAHAVDEAVAARSGSIVEQVDPARLAGHVHTALSTLADGGPGCLRPEMEWVAAPYLWDLAYAEALTRTDSPRELEVVLRARQRAQPVGKARAIVFGADPASGFEKALGIHRSDPTWPEAVHQMLDEFDARWAVPHLVVADDLLDGW